MERASQARFIPDDTGRDFVEGKPIPNYCEVETIGNVEIFRVKPEITAELVVKTAEHIKKSREDFYKANPHLHGERAYVAWLSHESDM